jgi:hypothetical protein
MSRIGKRKTIRRRTHAGFRTIMDMEDEKHMFRNLMMEFNETTDPQRKHDVMYRMARFLLHSRELMRNERFRTISMVKLQEMIDLPDAPPHLKNIALSALDRLERLEKEDLMA